MPKRSIPNVLEDILHTLEEANTPLTTREIAMKKGLDWETTEKYLGLLEKAGSMGRIQLLKSGSRMKLWSLEKPGLLSLPEDERRRIVLGSFPTPTPELQLLAKLYIEGAGEKPVQVEETPILKQLIKQGQLSKSKDGYRLTDEGCTVAKGTIKLYMKL